MAGTDAKKTLLDADIMTVQRRQGPQSAQAGTDVDSDAHATTDAAPATDSDTRAPTDRDAS